MKEEIENLLDIIQISTTGVADDSTTQASYITTALCMDGSVWIKHGDREFWRRLNKGKSE